MGVLFMPAFAAATLQRRNQAPGAPSRAPKCTAAQAGVRCSILRSFWHVCRFEKPTAIQAQAIPAALSGRDVLVRRLGLCALLYLHTGISCRDCLPSEIFIAGARLCQDATCNLQPQASACRNCWFRKSCATHHLKSSAHAHECTYAVLRTCICICWAFCRCASRAPQRCHDCTCRA